MLLLAVGFIILVVTPAVLKSSDIPAPSILIAPLVTVFISTTNLYCLPDSKVPEFWNKVIGDVVPKTILASPSPNST